MPIRISRRGFIRTLALGGAAAAGVLGARRLWRREHATAVFIAAVAGYDRELRGVIARGMRELGIAAGDVRGKRILLKPNLVEPRRDASHINTHPLVVHAAAEAFLGLGAASVVVAEGSGHQRDSQLVLEESGLADVLEQNRLRFIDLNIDAVVEERNRGDASGLKHFYFPEEVKRADWVVSVAKMKTHHWAGATLAMKNLFGVMPGSVYGWPKNVLHAAGIERCIYDITATLKPRFAIVDGIVGMEGDGPIMGEPVASRVVVMGENLPAVDATCARLMGIDPEKLPYLAYASGRIGSIRTASIAQRGEPVSALRREFRLLDRIPAHRRLRAA
jgi:uncharacterized protein (DUF362 family)